MNKWLVGAAVFAIAGAGTFAWAMVWFLFKNACE